MNSTDFVYTTYIKSTPQKVWEAVTNPEFCRQYWGHANMSDWEKGSEWKHISKQGEVRIIGKVLEINPPKRLVLSWADPANLQDDSQVTFEIEALNDVVRLTIIHGSFKAGSEMRGKVATGWPLVLSNMKSYLESGQAFDIWAIKSCK